jgi:type I restriction-modification system DNA methylase subunit
MSQRKQNMSKELLQKVIDSGAADRPLHDFFHDVSDGYHPVEEDLVVEKCLFLKPRLLGEISFSPVDKLAVVTAEVTSDLTERSGKKAQYEFGRKLLRDWNKYDGGIFIFKGAKGQFRFSLIYTQYQGPRREFNNFRRFTYFVDPDQTNKTFIERVGLGKYSSLEAIKEAFSVEKVNKEFYKQIAQYFYRLTGKDGKTRELDLPDNGSVNPKYLEEFSVRLIGRIIFCWFLKHKKSAAGIPLIPETVLSSNAVTVEYYHSLLERLFFEVMNTPSPRKPELSSFIPEHQQIPFLNGGLFEPHENDYYEKGMNPALKIPDSWFTDFFRLLEQYNFTIDENTAVDAEVSVDPEMMGRIFENLLAEVNPETGETARKSTGSYYTPRVIVDYMVEQSLKQYLLTKTAIGEDKADALLSYEKELENWTESEKESVVVALREIKILDPACGSGAFPLGILHRMIIALEKVDPELVIWRKVFLKGLDSFVRQTVEKNISKSNWSYIRKLMIIRDSIYGVDIQPIAVEISKLRCFLSLVVDEIVLDGELHRGIEPLPNLEFKFVAANSLVGLPPMINRQTGLRPMETEIKDEDPVVLLKNIRDAYLRSYGDEKKKLERDFMAMRTRMIEHNINWGGKDAMALQIASWNPFSYESSAWFEPDWMFGVSDRFDIVIANPPYDVLSANYPNIEYFKARYVVSRGGKNNLYKLFFERGLDVLKINGILTYISPRNYLTSADSISLRRLLATKTTLKEIAEYSEADKIFEAVTQAVCTIVLVKSVPSNSRFCYIRNQKCESIEQNKVIKDSRHFIKGTNPVIKKMEAQFNRLEDFIHGYQGEVNVSTKKRFFKNNSQSASDLPLVRGSHVKRYYTKDFPVEFCPVSIQTRDHYAIERIVFQEIANASLSRRLNAVIMNNVLCGHTTNYVFSKSKKVTNSLLIALMNSKLLNYYFRFYNQTNHIPIGEFKNIPVPNLHDVEVQPFINLVGKIIDFTNEHDYRENPAKQAKVLGYEKQIDQLVYKLYGLTDVEIEIVEDS